MSSFKDKDVYYRIYYEKNGITWYTDPTHDKNEAIELYRRHIERYSEVALVEIVENRKIIMDSLEN